MKSCRGTPKALLFPTVFAAVFGRLVYTIAAEKAYRLTLIYLLASEYKCLKAFSDVFGVTSQHVLSEFPDVAAIAAIPLDELTAVLRDVSRDKLKDAPDTVRTLHQVAADSYPLPDGLRAAAHSCLLLTLDTIRFLESLFQQVPGTCW